MDFLSRLGIATNQIQVYIELTLSLERSGCRAARGLAAGELGAGKSHPRGAPGGWWPRRDPSPLQTCKQTDIFMQTPSVQRTNVISENGLVSKNKQEE